MIRDCLSLPGWASTLDQSGQVLSAFNKQQLTLQEDWEHEDVLVRDASLSMYIYIIITLHSWEKTLRRRISILTCNHSDICLLISSVTWRQQSDNRFSVKSSQ